MGKKIVEVSFDFLRATKNTFRFSEVVPEPGKEPAVGDIYLRQELFDGDKPKKIKVTVEAVDDPTAS